MMPLATRTEIQYRVTRLNTPLALAHEFTPPSPEGDGWHPMNIAGNEVVFFSLWSRLVEIETAEDGSIVRTTSLVK